MRFDVVQSRCRDMRSMQTSTKEPKIEDANTRALLHWGHLCKRGFWCISRPRRLVVDILTVSREVSLRALRASPVPADEMRPEKGRRSVRRYSPGKRHGRHRKGTRQHYASGSSIVRRTCRIPSEGAKGCQCIYACSRRSVRATQML